MLISTKYKHPVISTDVRMGPMLFAGADIWARDAVHMATCSLAPTRF